MDDGLELFYFANQNANSKVFYELNGILREGPGEPGNTKIHSKCVKCGTLKEDVVNAFLHSIPFSGNCLFCKKCVAIWIRNFSYNIHGKIWNENIKHMKW